MFLLRTPRFLPTAWAAPSAAQRADAAEAAGALRRELARVQDPDACSAQRLVRCDAFEAGLGSTISSVLKSHSFALTIPTSHIMSYCVVATARAMLRQLSHWLRVHFYI